MSEFIGRSCCCSGRVRAFRKYLRGCQDYIETGTLFGGSAVEIGQIVSGDVHCVDPLNGYHWVDGWSILFHRDLYNLIGGFDEAFKASGYLDGDFCFRAAEAGFQSHWGNLPLRHLRSSTRLQLPGYAEGKAFNRAYLKEKWGLEELYG